MSSRQEIVDLTIRAAEMADTTGLASLMCELGYETSYAEMTNRLRAILPDSQFKTFVALIKDQVCGMIGTVAHPSYEHDDLSGKIVALVVTEKMRGQGLGRQLLAAAENDFAQRGIHRIALTTRFSREEAHRFYEKLGYVRNGFRFVKNLEPVAG